MSNLLEEESWRDVASLLQRRPVVIVPTGSVEQHGPHLPLGTDAILTAAIAGRVADVATAEGTPVVVTPTVWTGFSPHHMRFAGTISLDLSAFEQVVTQVVASLWAHGFRKIFVLNGHGGNSNALRATVQQLRFGREIRVAVADYWAFASAYLPGWRESGLGGIDHACEMETALMLAVREDLVRKDEVRDALWQPRSRFLSGDLTVGGPVSVAWDLAELNGDGAAGAPQYATMDRGRSLLEHIVGEIGAFVSEFRDWDWETPRSI
jgi:creatinine amidohydrolase